MTKEYAKTHMATHYCKSIQKRNSPAKGKVTDCERKRGVISVGTLRAKDSVPTHFDAGP
jgi:hypothetical protein